MADPDREGDYDEDRSGRWRPFHVEAPKVVCIMLKDPNKPKAKPKPKAKARSKRK
jgi:hypothetical protein